MRATPIHYFKSLNRHFTIFGVDRQMFYLIVAISFPIAYSAHFQPMMDLIALMVFVVLHTISILVTRVDNQIMAIYRRHIHYKKYYAANPGIHASVPPIKPSVPVYQGKRGLI